MNFRTKRDRGEEGATLIFVIGFMVLVGLVCAGLATQLATSSKTRVALDKARNREYAADAAILTDLAQVRDNMTNNNQALAPCPSAKLTQTLNGVTIQVDCSFSLFSLSGLLQRNARFRACVPQPGGADCPFAASIIDAQVHYQAPEPPNSNSITVDKTYVLTWSVNS